MTELNNTSAPNTESTSTNATSAEVPTFAPVGDEKNFPMTAKEAPISGIIPSKDVPFKDQVAGHAKYYAGLVTRNDSEVQQGAAIVRGDAQAIPKASKDGAAASKES